MHESEKNGEMRRHARCIVRQEDRPASLLDYLCIRFPYHNAVQWRALIAEGRLLVNDRTATIGEEVGPGESLEYLAPPRGEPPVERSYRVVYEDERLFVVDKPGNLPTHPSGRFFNNTLWAALRQDRPGQALHFVNRLDRETSGLVLVAKDTATCAATAAAVARPEAVKSYQVMVEGLFPDRLQAEGGLVSDTESHVRKKMAFVARGGAPPEGMPARTHFRRLRGTRELSLVEARLETGRTHQIRATLCSLGYPVVGDKLYGVDETIFLRFIAGEMTADDRAALRTPRQALHAHALVFHHPHGGRLLDLRAPMPKDMASLLEAL
jgi:23S rRNA pseudouridine955/2504/2580 synthase/23S rRNA pseudouridine1911/1915/1917 synthase